MTTDRFAPLSAIVDDALASGIARHLSVSVAVRTASDEQRWNRDGDDIFLSASTIKVAILIAVARAIDAGTLRHDDRRSARPEDAIEGSGVLTWMEPGLSLSIDDHAYLMIAISDNTASNVLIEAVGRAAVNEAMTALGTTHSALRRPFLGAVPTDDLPRNEITTNDLVTLLSAIMDDRVASAEGCAWMRKLLALQQHTDRLGRDLPERVTFLGKSGTIERHVHDSAVLVGPGGSVVMAVLTEGDRSTYAVDPVLGRLARRAAEIAGLAQTRSA